MTGPVSTQRYVAVEGVEGAGKSTVVQAIADHLRGSGAEVVTVREPGGTGVGERIRAILLDGEDTPTPWTEALLFAAARAQLVAEVVGPALVRGAWVVSDRSVYSSLAYQGGGRGLGVEAVRTLNEPGLRGVWPGRVVLLDVDARSGLRRQVVDDRIGGEGVGFVERVAATFRLVAAEEADRFVVVDASRSLEEVVADVVRAIGPPR